MSGDIEKTYPELDSIMWRQGVQQRKEYTGLFPYFVLLPIHSILHGILNNKLTIVRRAVIEHEHSS